jgi:hypothetical protein
MTAFFAAEPARAELIVDITSGFVEPLPIAVTNFYGDAPAETRVGADISGVIAANLERIPGHVIEPVRTLNLEARGNGFSRCGILDRQVEHSSWLFG